MDGEAFLGGLIRFVVALGIVSAAFTVGEDVLEPEGDDLRVASSGGQGGAAGAIPDAAKAVNATPPTNRSGGSDGAGPCGAPGCVELLVA